jgi:hypothetical protein
MTGVRGIRDTVRYMAGLQAGQSNRRHINVEVRIEQGRASSDA